ncbi:glycosyltransferase family 9 protein [Roseateles sp. BYS96W]|uniref:Glycosyltransferase family 9 protein n=1 Tax=Pelomonas nitida TaxID=3299027 RepID=A0ABW7G4T6_9BURK
MTSDDRQPLAPQRGRYFMRHRGFNLLFRSVDALLRALVPRCAPSPRPVRRILIANGAHLGDIVLSTAILPVIKAAYPDARIGMLVGGWAGPVVKNHQLVDWVHRLDHWRLNRAALSTRAKIQHWWRTRRQALREIRARDYDVALDLYFYFPNSAALLWQAGIPTRIGYTSAGLGPLLTESLDIDMAASRRSIVDFHLDLVRRIPGIGTARAELAVPNIPRSPVDLEKIIGPGNYVVLHLGSGSALKDWPESSWAMLARQFLAQGRRLVLTGTGTREKEKIERFRREVPDTLDLCDRLKWNEFVEIIAHASLLVASDSVAAHIAAAVDTPAVVTGHGMTNLHLWRPASPRAVVLMQAVPCAPCYRNGGCSTMACLRELAPSTVQAACDALLAAPAAVPAA